MKKAGVIIGNFLGVIVVALYVNGCIHSSNKHEKDGDTLRYTPFSVYRGIEFFWHDDFAGVNWQDRTKDDALTSIQLLSGTNQTYDLVNTKEQIEVLSKKFATYPSDKKASIAATVREFLNFGNLWATDIVSSLEDSFATELKFSPATKRSFENLNNNLSIELMQPMKLAGDSLVRTLREAPADRDVYVERLKTHSYTDNIIYAPYFKKLFGEELVTIK